MDRYILRNYYRRNEQSSCPWLTLLLVLPFFFFMRVAFIEWEQTMNRFRIGILYANKDRPEFEPGYPNDGVKYQRFFQAVFPDAHFDIFAIREEEWPQEPTEYDVYFITGSAFSVYEKLSWIRSLEVLIRQLHHARIPLVGICFGHQIIARALGGVVEKSDAGWGLGIKSVTFDQPTDWMIPPQHSMRLSHIHQDQVVTLPAEATRFCGDDFCPYGGFTIGNHIITIQGHPEFTVDYMKLLLPHIQDSFTDDAFADAMQTLNAEEEGAIFAQWIAAFVHRAIED